MKQGFSRDKHGDIGPEPLPGAVNKRPSAAARDPDQVVVTADTDRVVTLFYPRTTGEGATDDTVPEHLGIGYWFTHDVCLWSACFLQESNIYDSNASVFLDLGFESNVLAEQGG
jgi:hypothetical protein